MKFVLFCDVLRAPGERARPTIGLRLSGAAVKPSAGESDSDFNARLQALFDGVRGRDVPKPGEAGFEHYLDDLARGAGPLFPWLGGRLDFSLLWASAPARQTPQPGAIDPTGFGVTPIALPADGNPAHNANFELSDASLNALLYTALKDLASDTAPTHTDHYHHVEPFKLIGWNEGQGGRQEIEEIGDTGANFRYEAFFAGLASLPAPLPHGRLNLVRFVRLDTIKPAPAGQTTLLIAAPRFQPRAATSVLEPAFGDQAHPTVQWNLVGPNLVASIPYMTPFGGHEIEVLCRALDLGEDLTRNASFLDRETLWVKRSHTRGVSDSRDGIGFEDWLARLPEQLADVFDLPRLVLQAVEDDATSPGTPLTAALSMPSRPDGAMRLAEAVLMALRDTVGPGCVATASAVLTGPNGSPAHLAILERVNRIIVESRPGSELNAQELRALADGVERDDRAFRNAFRNGAGDPQRAVWLGRLAKIAGANLNLPAGAGFLTELAARVAVGPDAKGAFDPSPLRRAVDELTTPAAAAALQIEIWRHSAPADARHGAWLSAAEAAFPVLFDRGFRLVEILKKANIDLAWAAPDGIWKKASDPDIRDTEALAGSERHRGNIREAITSYLYGTLCESDGSPTTLEWIYQDDHGRIGRLPASARGVLADAVDTAARVRMQGWFKQPDKEGTDTLLTGDLAPDAHGVMLQIDRLVVAAGDTPDFNEDLAGYGLLMRRSRPADAWRCLTACFAELAPDSDMPVPATFVSAPRAVMGALPVSYTSRMPQVIVTYDNRPIVGDGQADIQTEGQTEDDPQPRIARLVQPRVQDNPPAETLLPFLAYGATFDVAPFGISNQGAFPVEIRRDDFPALLDPAKLTDDLFAANADIVRRFSYLRRTGIGSLRVAPAFAPAQRAGALFHPMVPPRETRLVADEILVPPQAIEPWAPSGAVRALKMKTALLLSDANGDALVVKPDNACGELRLRVEAPVTTLEDFDRWIAFDETVLSDADKTALRQFRKALRTFHFEQTAALHDRELALRKAVDTRDGAAEARLRAEVDAIKATLDLQDPSVGVLAVSVTRVRRDGALAPDAVGRHTPELFAWRWTWKPDLDPTRPFATARPPIDVICKVSKDRTKPLFDAATKTVWSTPGDVVIVRLFAGVDDALFVENVAPAGRRRFDDCVRRVSLGAGDKDAVVTAADGTHYRLFSTYAFAVEAASPGLPADIEIAAAVSGSIVDGGSGAADESPGDIRLHFRRTPSVASDAIGSLTVGSQAWRWTGRPLSPFPFDKTGSLNVFPVQDPQDPLSVSPPSAAESALLWDMEGFAERLDETLDDEMAPLPLSEQIDLNATPPASTARATRIALRTPNRSEVARYMRFRVTAVNRYASAYQAARQKNVGTCAARWTSVSGKWETPWFRIVRPAAIPDVIPKPGLRALIPLTRALRDGEVSPVAGVLAVVDGAWFEHAGPAEWLLAGVETAYRKTSIIPGSPAGAVAAEIGPDPLVRTYGLGQAPRQTPTSAAELRSAVPLAVTGPLGHSFDSGTATGLFLNSSFIVPAPALAADDPAAWWMGKLAFRRLILAEGTRGYRHTSKDQKKPSNTVQIGATVHSIAATTTPASLKLRATGKLSWGALTADATTAIEASRTGPGWSITVENSTPHAKDRFDITTAGMDLRLIAVRRVARIPAGPEQYVWYELLLLVKPRNRPWQLAWQTQWFNDMKLAQAGDPAKAELAFAFVTEARTNVTCDDPLITTIPQVSDATEGRWTQFLPNMQTLARSAKVDLGALALSVDSRANERLRLTAGGQPFAWLPTNALKTKRGQDDQGLFNLLLVTKRITSVSDSNEEAYVGLYHSAAGYDPAEQAVVLTWFDRGPPRALTGKPDLIGRILTVRAGSPSVSDAQIAEWQNDPWKAFFPHERSLEQADPAMVFGETRPPDASAQIVEIYSPIISRDISS
ncbi:protein of unknown function [Bradyrhizobium sp. ORS 285]|uniref:hypothetical protein n=1 Tax=Bradyrhizobium sp. ORS 285 TaxID=115808 RepID=UPI0002409491|nr:hypothetical protein [Bradyrhizobium sp. ORS 285]CCD85164.1 hypothetical protein BRAO285_1350015 [Bradyrhizobium sp. ORS 285]SMX58196.1 protein of unknown function [Bradyrhizobium sp. ORS 285]